MPTISNATVATGTGLSTAGNGGRKLVRLSNGWLVSVTKTTNYFYFYVSKDSGSTWSQLCWMNNAYISNYDVAITCVGTYVYIVSGRSGAYINTHFFNATTVTNTNILGQSPYYINNLDSQTEIGAISVIANDTGTELHAAWSSKNATYPNSFNIRYAKGTINGDGSVTWGAVEQVTNTNNSGYTGEKEPTIALDKNNVPVVICTYQGASTQQWEIHSYRPGSPFWVKVNVFQSGSSSYTQSNPSALYVPQSINGLANGRLWVAWHGKDATDSAKFNVRVSYSDDGGVTWATPTKLTTGNLYDRQNVTLAADKTGKVFALYEEHQWSPDLDIYMRTFSGGSWSAPVAVAEADPAAESNPSALVDYSLMMTTPPFVFMSGTDGIKFSGNFNVGASVSPVSGSLGSKETPTITAYTVTPENGSTVTQIVEKLNGVTLNTYNNPASLSRTFTVPQLNWDGIPFWNSHTAEIVVTDSNGAVATTTYTFVKALADNAPTLEGVAATEDAYERISDKRDALAAQVGLSAGSTFDAISAQLASGQVFKKFATGTVTANISGTISVSGLAFKPRIITVYRTSDKYVSLYYDSVIQATSYVGVANSSPVYRTNMSVTNDGFSVTYDLFGGNTLTWTAIE